MKSQRGVALIVVMLLLAVMAALAGEMAVRFTTSVKRASYQQDNLQLMAMIHSAEQFAAENLLQDLKDNPKFQSTDHYWAQPQKMALSAGLAIEWQVRDDQACFNLNSLGNTPTENQEDMPYNQQVFESLLLMNGVTKAQAGIIIDSIADYIDSDTLVRSAGAEDDYYLREKPPRLTANQPFFSVSELSQIKGMSPKLYQALQAQLCALPSTQQRININTLTEQQGPLLSALSLEQFSAEEAIKLLAKRPKMGWVSLTQFYTQLDNQFPATDKNWAPLNSLLAVTSRYFSITSTASDDDQQLTLSSRLYYDEKSGELRLFSRHID
ncbi:type II secretion system protein K [Chimaeribacter californicus]|uniref:Type II secretion system protein K n=1 Tax=Chimaeribacter californicus TaxID=2060067 RepID=A0A2N5DVE0_9GAMM|nr:type II secretion system minor pseudopilin GspK [Chimaeribacter californicus]PLR30997.1 type II secretion system protein K [Chimaeribacter californicus]